MSSDRLSDAFFWGKFYNSKKFASSTILESLLKKRRDIHLDKCSNSFWVIFF